jgi:hypothetical protein
MILAHQDNSVIQFTPDASMRWIVDIRKYAKYGKNKGHGAKITAAVVGWAVVVTRTDVTNEGSTAEMHTRVEPIVLGYDGKPQTETEFAASGDMSCSFELHPVEPEEWQCAADYGSDGGSGW